MIMQRKMLQIYKRDFLPQRNGFDERYASHTITG